MKIMVWKCDHTGKLFEDHDKYKKHLRKLANTRRVRKSLEIEENARKEWWAYAQNLEMGIDELVAFIIKNQDKFWVEASKAEAYDWKDVGKRTYKNIVMPVPVLSSFRVFSLSWSDSVSNSHRCPKDGVTNWGRHADQPTGYPGWRGRVEWSIEWPKQFEHCYIGSDLFSGDLTRIHTGTGGGGGWKDGLQSFGYDVTIFASDWPGLARHHEKQMIWEKLSN
jgi:hypothetical protein